MKTKATILTIFTAVIIFGTASFKIHHEEEAIKETILTGYVHGAFNELDPDAMGKTFHEEFAIFSTDGQNLRRYPIAVWRENVTNQKNDPNFDPANNVWEHKFSEVDVSGNSAMVKLELYNEGEHVYTDYLSLLKFDDGWKIVAKVYYRHELPKPVRVDN